MENETKEITEYTKKKKERTPPTRLTLQASLAVYRPRLHLHLDVPHHTTHMVRSMHSAVAGVELDTLLLTV